jgi:hypothetical protein
MKRKKLWIMAVAVTGSMLSDAARAAQMLITPNTTPRTFVNKFADKNNFWLAKLNSCALLEGKLRLAPLNQKIDFAAIATKSKLPTVALEIVDGKIFCPFLFSKLHLFLPSGKKVTLVSGFFRDTNVQFAFARRNLTIGDVHLEDWKNLWHKGKLQIFATYKEKNSQILPNETKNPALDNIPPQLCQTPTIQKVAIGAATASATALSIYFLYKACFPRIASKAAQEPILTPISNAPIGEIPQHIPPEASNTPSEGETPTLNSNETQNVNSQVQSHYFNAETFNANRTFDQVNPLVIFAGAPNLPYRCYNPNILMSGIFNFGKNYFKRMLDLEYDLFVAENKCDWTAMEAIARELLGIINEHGAPPNGNTGDEVMQRMVGYQHMVALHAAMVLQRIAIQRKTTEICRAHLGHLTAEELFKGIASNQYQTGVSFDRPLEIFLARAPESEFVIHQSPFAAYTADHVRDIIELAKILNNPLWLKSIISPFEKGDRTTYEEQVIAFINKNFNFSGKEFLKKLTIDYFMGTYEKIAKFLAFYRETKLKLRDCNGGDIFSNGDVCSYCSTFELIRREPGNASLVAAGSIFDAKKFQSIINKSKGCQMSTAPYRRFNEQGMCVYNSSEERAKLLQQRDQKMQEIDKVKNHIKKYDQEIGNTSDIATRNKLIEARNGLVAQHGELCEEFNRNLNSYNVPLSVDLLPTNDLSSRIRVQTAYQVWVANMNRFLADSQLLQPSAKIKLQIEKSVMPRLDHIGASEPSTAMEILQRARCCGEKLDIMLAAMGVALANFNGEGRKNSKLFFNETTTNPLEKGSVYLGLGCVHIFDPFSPIIVTGGFHDHARLGLQY